MRPLTLPPPLLATSSATLHHADIQYPGLVRVHNDGTTNTNIVQLHLGQLALAGGAPGGAPGGSATAGSGGSGSAAPPPKQRQGGAAGAAPSPKPKPAPPVPNQYETSSTPSRHLVLLGVAQRADVAVLTDMARQHGFVQKFLHNPRKASLVLHFSSIEEALSMAREVEGRTLPGLSGGYLPGGAGALLWCLQAAAGLPQRGAWVTGRVVQLN